MNRNFHRIIFNAARGLRMVVQETALSTGRGTSRATAGRGVALRFAAVVAMLASAPLQAQIAGDRNAPGAQRPVVLTAPNGVPLVNIQAPSAAGVSHNVYRQFDVGANGAILNNSRTNVQTQLGGFVAGNPMLAHGAARVIVNEVRSTDPSLLRGFIEVAGQRADVIVANPAGISVDGGGFINVHRATLTTGVPQFGIAGNLEAYVVRGGRIAVAGAGLDAGGTDSLAILTRAFELSGALHAGDLKVVTGANRIDADLAGIVPITGQAGAPAYAIDVARLGGMYAGHIALVVNEAGVGARNAGMIQTATGPYTVAGGGQLSLSASGRLENSGFIQAASDAAIDAAGVANGGVVQSAAGLRITTRDDLANHLATTAGTLEGARLELTSTAGDLDNRGGILRQTGGGALAIDAPHLSNAQGGVIGVPPAPAPVPSPAPAATGAPTGAPAPTSPPTGSGTATGSGAGAASGGAGGAASPAVPAPAPPAPGRIAAAAGRILNDGGTIHAGGDITLRTTDLDNAGGTLRLADLSVSGAGFSNAGGTLDVGRAFTARVATLDNAGGTLRAGALDIETTADLDNHGGTLASGGAAHLRVGGGLDNAHGTISAIDALDATVAGALDDTAGQLVANAALTVSAATLDNTRGTLQSAGDAAKVDVVGHVRNDQGRIGAATDLDLRAGSLTNTGAIRAERDGRITVATRLDNGSEAGAGGNPTSASGTITSGRHTAITAGVLASDASGALGAGIGGDGKPGATGDLSVSTTGRLAAGGTMLAAGRLALRGADVDLSGAQVRGAEVALTAATGDVVTRHARVAASGSLSVAATGTDAATLVNSEGSLDAGRLDLHVANLRNTAGGRLVQTGADALDIAIAGTLDNAGGVIASNGAELALSARRLVNEDGAIEHAGTGTLALTAATFDGARGRVVGNGEVALRAGTVDQHGGSLSGRGVRIDGTDIDNRDGTITQTGAGTETLRLTASGTLANDGGTIAGNGTDMTLTAGLLSNAQGHLKHAGDGTLALTAADYHGAGGEIAGNGALVARVAGDFDHAGATTTVRRLALEAGTLDNRSGQLVQTGTDAARIAVEGVLDNGIAEAGSARAATGGRIASQGDLALGAGELRNRGGGVQAAGPASLDVVVTGLLDNGAAGVIGAGGRVDVRVQRLVNETGAISALGDLRLDVATGLANAGGTLAAQGATTVVAARLDNRGGTIAAIDGDLAVTTPGAIDNTDGALQAGGGTRLSGQALDNTRGKVTGRTLAIDTAGGAIANDLGKLAAARTLELRGGALDNDRGLLQSGGAMRIDVQALNNTRAAGYIGSEKAEKGGQGGQGGIVSGGTLTLVAADVDNTAGFIGAHDTLDASTGAFTNGQGGVVLGQADVRIATRADADYDNRGGQTLAAGALTLDAGHGAIRNAGALIRSAGITTLSAGSVDNSATSGLDQGIEGRDVAIEIVGGVGANRVLDNDAGAIRAATDLSVTSSGTVRNVGGLMSAGGTLVIVDPNRADATARTLAVVNTGGRLIADKGLTLDAARFSGDGTLASGKDLSITLTQDVVNDATVSANGNLTYATTGVLTNRGRLSAGGTLSVAGRDVTNAASGTMRGDTTLVKAEAGLTNHGLIDGRDTRIDARTLVNGPTGRIYGDHLSIAADSVLNDADGTSAGSIAARDRLDIGAATLVNRPQALILSGGDMHIGGALDADRKATGRATRVENHAATIEALGDLAIDAQALENRSSEVTWTMKQAQQQRLEFAVTQGGQRLAADEVFIGSPRMDFGPGGGVSWRTVAGGVPDTNSDDKQLQLLVPSPDYPVSRFRAYYLQSPVKSGDSPYQVCASEDTASCKTQMHPGAWHGRDNPIWATFGVAPPARDLPASHPYRLDPDVKIGQDGIYATDTYGNLVLVQPFDHPVTQAEIDEGRAYVQAHQALDEATSRFIQTMIGGLLTAGVAAPSRFFDDYYIWNYTGTTSTPELNAYDPGRIIAGQRMTLTVDSGVNDMSQILAGGALRVLGGSITNRAVEAQETTEGHGSLLHTYVRAHTFGSDKRTYESTNYDEVTPPRTVTLAAARLQGDTAVTSHQGPAAPTSVAVEPGSARAGAVGADHHLAPIVEVAIGVPAPTPGAGDPRNVQAVKADPRDPATSTTDAPATPSNARQPLVARTTTPDATLPRASLFRTMPGASAHHLIETDPAFADERRWQSSDYLLDALGRDPALVTKRLGDGFYEQRLIREQVAQLTGHRYLDGFDDDNDQYLALMDSGRTFAQQWHLTPGIALTPAQMAQLTSDVVWLVEQTVTLADGTTERVLVPQVYVRVRPGDIDGSGALLSGESLTIEAGAGKGDVVNTGTLAGRQLVSITADNIQNLGGRISSAGGGASLDARVDLNNLGGTIDAANAVGLKAGRDLRVASTTQTAAGAHSTSTQLDRLAGVYVTNPGGTLVASAGRDVALVGAILSNTGAGSTTSVKAGRDLVLGTVETSRSLDIERDDKNRIHTAQSAEIGTQILGGSGTKSTVTLNAGRDLVARQATVQTEGVVTLHADRDLDLQAGQTTRETDSHTQTTTRGLLSRTTTMIHESSEESLNQASRISGGLVSLGAGRDLTGEGVKISGDQGVLVQAGGVLDLHEARDVRSQTTEVGVRRIGFGVGTTGVPVPDKRAATDVRSTFDDTAAVTSIDSAHGGVRLEGGALATLQGVQVSAARDVKIQADAVKLTGAVDQHSRSTQHD